MIPQQFHVSVRPEANQSAIIQPNDVVRFTLLTSQLVRMEYAPNGRFEDRATQTFWHRDLEVPTFTLEELASGVWQIGTDHLTLTYDSTDTQSFTADNLTITQKDNGEVWRYGDQTTQNLGGTYRTLDERSGSVPLGEGLLSSEGWAVVDDSGSLVLTAESWIAPRKAHPQAKDLYFFGYGRRYEECLQDFCRIAGETPLIPRSILGNWWSRYWEYTDQELRELIQTFQEHDIPLSVCIIDMDWHITETAGYHSGWTGYTWNPIFFPDPADTIAWLHEQGLRTTLNLHPADGVAPHEAMYPEMAERMGIDPDSKTPIPFRIDDPTFAKAYFELLHHPQEENGIDFWWIDWQQGETSNMEGLDPLWMLNHLHFYDLGRDGVKRPFIFSRWGELGSHRYPIGFSGDSYTDWPSLAFQPKFTSTAANVAYGWWSHDIGGHMLGTEEGELYTRWVQFGVFSPILRLHSTKNQFHERHPWGYDAEVLRVVGAAMRLRHALIPYIYSMAWRNVVDSLPLVQPLYHWYPDEDAAYHSPQEYTFGTELIAAPFTEPIDPDTRLSRQLVWFPDGEWFNFFTGEYYAGGRWQAVYGRLDEIPVFAKAGAIIPIEATAAWGSGDNPTDLDIHLFAGADNTFTLYEDDGETIGYQKESYAQTYIHQAWDENRLVIAIDPVDGDISHIPNGRRNYTLQIHGIIEPDQLILQIDEQEIDLTPTYDPDGESLEISLGEMKAESQAIIIIETEAETLLSRRDRKAEKLADMIATFRLGSQAKMLISKEHYLLPTEPERLLPYSLALSSSQMRALLEVITEAGIHSINYGEAETQLMMWNNFSDDDIRYVHSSMNESKWIDGRFNASHGETPTFKAFTQLETDPHPRNNHKPNVTWRLSIDYRGLFTYQLGNGKE